MRIEASLLEILVCPACRAEVRLDEVAEELVCRGCGLAYPVRDDIPVMLVDEARRPAPPTRREPVHQQPVERRAAAEGPGDVPDVPAPHAGAPDSDLGGGFPPTPPATGPAGPTPG